MPGLPAFVKHLRLVALLLVVAAFGVRGAVPAGYMLDAADDGSVLIRLCGDGEGRLLRLDPGNGQLTELPADPGHAPGTDDGTCPYALSAAFDVPTTPPAIQPPAFFGLPLLGPRPYARPLADRPAIAPLPPRGPPVLI